MYYRSYLVPIAKLSVLPPNAIVLFSLMMHVITVCITKITTWALYMWYKYVLNTYLIWSVVTVLSLLHTHNTSDLSMCTNNGVCYRMAISSSLTVWRPFSFVGMACHSDILICINNVKYTILFKYTEFSTCAVCCYLC